MTKAEVPDGRYRVQALDRAIDILEAFSPNASRLTLAEVAKRCELSRPTTFRLLASLASRGLIAQAGNDYMLGSQLSALAAVRGRSFGLLDHSLPVMRQVRDELDESISLGVRVGDYRVQVHQELAWSEARRSTHEGDRSPLYAGAANKLLLSALPNDQIEQYLQRVELAPFTSNTLTSPEDIRAELQRIRRDGYASSKEEKYIGGASIATPIRDAFGTVSGALYASIPISRFTDDHRAASLAALLKGASLISKELGYRGQEKHAQRQENE